MFHWNLCENVTVPLRQRLMRRSHVHRPKHQRAQIHVDGESTARNRRHDQSLKSRSWRNGGKAEVAVKSCPAAVICSKRDAECAGGSFTVNPAQLHERLFTASSSQQLQRKAQWWQVSSSSGSHTFSETRSSWSRRVAAAGRRSPRRAPLLADAVILAARVSVGRRATGASLLPSVRHGVALRARPRVRV